MNRDRDRHPLVPSPSVYSDSSWRGISEQPQTPGLKRRLRHSLVVQSQRQFPRFQAQWDQVQKQWPVVQEKVVAQVQLQWPRIQKLVDEQMQLMPARIEYMRYAHKQKFGKNLVRGLFGVSGALCLMDLSLIDQLWF